LEYPQISQIAHRTSQQLFTASAAITCLKHSQKRQFLAFFLIFS
jgi:hypothetical protein